MKPAAANSGYTIRSWKRGQRLFRVHPERYQATEFNTSAKGDARFSPLLKPNGDVIPTLYAGSTLDCALMETVFHDVPFVRGPKLHSKAKHVAGKVASELLVKRDLKLIDLTAVALRKLGIRPEALTRTDASRFAATRAWALAAHADEPEAEGLLWTSRQDDTAFAMVLFGNRLRPDAIQSSGEGTSLLRPDGAPRTEIQSLAARLDVLLI